MGFMMYALNKYQFKVSVTFNFISCGIAMFGYHRLFTYGLRKDKYKQYSEIYNLDMLETYKNKWAMFNYHNCKQYTTVTKEFRIYITTADTLIISVQE